MDRRPGGTGACCRGRVATDGAFAGAGDGDADHLSAGYADAIAGGGIWGRGENDGVVSSGTVVLKHVSRAWGTMGYRGWHEAALRRNLGGYLKNQPADAILAQCPISAHAAMEVRRKLGLKSRVAMVCHFNHSEAREYRESG